MIVWNCGDVDPPPMGRSNLKTASPLLDSSSGPDRIWGLDWEHFVYFPLPPPFFSFEGSKTVRSFIRWPLGDHKLMTDGAPFDLLFGFHLFPLALSMMSTRLYSRWAGVDSYRIGIEQPSPARSLHSCPFGPIL